MLIIGKFIFYMIVYTVNERTYTFSRIIFQSLLWWIIFRKFALYYYVRRIHTIHMGIRVSIHMHAHILYRQDVVFERNTYTYTYICRYTYVQVRKCITYNPRRGCARYARVDGIRATLCWVGISAEHGVADLGNDLERIYTLQILEFRWIEICDTSALFSCT